MTSELDVRHEERRVGVVRTDAQGRFCFRYEEDWLARKDAFPISLSLPLLAEEWTEGPAHSFFANLLPEGLVRQAVCRRIGISESNDFELLRAIGGECAGAFSVVESRTRLVVPDAEYERLAPARLQKLVAGDDRVVPLLIGGATTRLSLAGAQDKVPVAVFDDELYLPLNGAPSTHILKLPNKRYPRLPQNEAFVMGLARQTGLECASSELTTATKPSSLLVERYDRRVTTDPSHVRRLHQEDLCQALGLMPGHKYEQEGGPTLARAVALVRASVVEPLVDVRRVIEWQAFNAAVGNADGHGKNLSILFDDTGPRLAPFYDLVSTREYASLDRRLAMSVGGRRNADELGKEQWKALARDLEMRDRAIFDIVGELLVRIAQALPVWTETFRAEAPRDPVLQTLPRRVKQQVTRLQRALV